MSHLNEDPMLVLLEAMVTGANQAIENQEARGQQKLVNSEVLPIKCSYCTRAQLEQMGIVFGEQIDDLFVQVQLPEGWHKEATEHNMWSKLLDEKGRERASIFYKAAFYDRDAFIGLERRYHAMVVPISGDYNDSITDWQAVVQDGHETIWDGDTIGPEPHPGGSDEWHAWYESKGNLVQQAVSWLEENYPDYQNPLAYW